MILFIAFILLYQFEYSWFWYLVALVIFVGDKFYEEHRFNKAFYWLEDRLEKIKKDIVGKDEEEFKR